MRPVKIVGGGLAGLSLGAALARSKVPVTVFEKGRYPRHKVCGEFITGLSEFARERLSLSSVLHDAQLHRKLVWMAGTKPLFSAQLPEPALGISRWCLDARLARAFVETGGHLVTERRLQPPGDETGWVLASGRKREKRDRQKGASWIGLKAHYHNLPLAAELELHLGRSAYAGLCPVEDGRVNVCLLFRASACPAAKRGCLESVLGELGLSSLAQRLRLACCVGESRCAVAGFALGRSAPSDHPTLGDGFAMIPPFTGHGMAMAFESAALALSPLIDYSHGRISWEAASGRIRAELSRRFSRRMQVAGRLHPFILEPLPQCLLQGLVRTRLLPWKSLYRFTHS